MKLKTLKELKEYVHDYDIMEKKDVHPSCRTEIVEIKDLRQEAINWVKRLNESLEDETKIPKCNLPIPKEIDYRGHTLSQITWIKHFFNISSEELK